MDALDEAFQSRDWEAVEFLQDEEDAERIAELKETLSKAINSDPNLGTAYPRKLEEDIYYEGPLAALLEFFWEWRSELEELG